MRAPITILLITILLTACSSNKSWTGYFYPDRNNIGDESTWITEPRFNTIEECRDWVSATAGNNTNYDYECGYDCKYNAAYGMNVCDKTER